MSAESNEAVVTSVVEFLSSEYDRLHVDPDKNKDKMPPHARLMTSIRDGMSKIADIGFKTARDRFTVNGPGSARNDDGTCSIVVKLEHKTRHFHMKPPDKIVVTYKFPERTTNPREVTTVLTHTNDINAHFALQVDAKKDSEEPDIHTLSVFGAGVTRILNSYRDSHTREVYLEALEPYYHQQARLRFPDPSDDKVPPIDFSASEDGGYEYKPVFSIHPEDPEYENICAALYAELGSLKR